MFCQLMNCYILTNKQKFLPDQMNKKKIQTIEEFQPSGKFLSRHQSSIDFSFFSCCTTPNTLPNDQFAYLPEKYPQTKISIKKLVKQRTAYNLRRNCIQKTLNQKNTFKNSQIGFSKRESYTKASYGVSERIRRQSFDGRNSVSPHKIFFTYNNKLKQSKNEVHNYQTTNFIVGKCIVNPETVNVFVQHPSSFDKKSRSSKAAGYECLDVFQQEQKFQPSQQSNSNTQKKSSTNKFASVDYQAKEPVKPDQNAMFVNYSFGHQQKTLFMQKFMKQMAAQPQQVNEQLDEIESQHFSNGSTYNQHKKSIDLCDEKVDDFLFLRGTFNKRGMKHFMRRAQTMHQDLQPSQSSHSDVIDDFRSIMDRIQTEKKEGMRASYFN